MKKLEGYIDRPGSILTGKTNLEHLYTLGDFPVFMGCTDHAQDEDITADMIWSICPETGMIQLRKLIPLNILYQDQHNEGIGSVWADHYASFVSFLKKYEPKRILEIGGAHGLVATSYLDRVKDSEWTIIEPNPTTKDGRIKVIRGWFDTSFKGSNSGMDAIVHSHVLEHTYDPKAYLEAIGSFLKPGQKQIFSFPNMVGQLSRKYTNCLNFEHTAFISEYFADALLKATGFKIVGKEYYKDHSIFYAAEKVGDFAPLRIESRYEEYKDLFTDFVSYHQEMVEGLNQKITASKTPVYLFGAHIFSQYLIGFGLKTSAIRSVLDNGPAKIGKRLYGTSLLVDSPKILKDKGPANVILKAGIYNDEIKKDIIENINPEVEFW